jgi:transcriptional regulator with PAS, ATPase and Fis domain
VKKTELQCIADTHEEPFLIMDQQNRVVAANQAFERAYRTTLAEILGKPCYQVTHGNDRPCHEMGEECPNLWVQETGEAHSCLHVHAHFDGHEHIHHVRVKAFPLVMSDGTFYLGESMVELSVRDTEDLERCMAGRSKAFLAALEAMQLAGKSDAPVLVQGETGTGKELAASFIHQNSARSKGPFLTLDCTVLTETLVESELFGHERGAFTGSVGDRQGLFALADGGTLFLDEIGEMPKPLQTKLLRVLESGEFRRVGGNRTLRSDVRIISATNRNLWQEVEQGNFREDLYYRMACITVGLPALRSRRDDIPELAEILLRRIRRPGQPNLRLTPAALTLLQEYDFPGNVRELRNILQAASAHAGGNSIDQALIQKMLNLRGGLVAGGRRVQEPLAKPAATRPGRPNLKEAEKEHIRDLLRLHAGNRAAVAKDLGVTERTVYRKLKEYGLS